MGDDGGLGMLADELLRKLSEEMGKDKSTPLGQALIVAVYRIGGWEDQINEWIRKSDEFDYGKKEGEGRR